MNPLPTRYAPLRDRTHWEAAASALAFDVDGVASLMRIPMPNLPVALPGPFAVQPSGVACAACSSAFVSDTDHDRVVYLDGLCAAKATLAGFQSPRGLAFAPGRGLYVADSGNARVVLLRDPTLETTGIITSGLTQPMALALDGERLLVVDGAAGSIRRFDSGGVHDAPWDAAMAAHAPAARFIAAADDGTLYVANALGALLRFDRDAAALAPWPALDASLRAGALAASGGSLYVADTASGRIAVLDRASGATLATVPSFQGPVTALAVCDSGELLVKTGDDDSMLRFALDAYASSGALQAGPLDAGVGDAWYVALCEADTPEGTRVGLALYAGDDPFAPPGPADWIEAPASSALVANLFPAPARYLWMRVTLASAGNAATPRLSQVRAETPGEDYLDHLPAIYRNADADEATLARMLAALRVQFDESERIIDTLPVRTAIDFAPTAELPWLASWLGFDLPVGLPGGEQRALLHRVVELYDRRSTPRGLAEIVHVYTGVRPRIVEAFRDRHLWQLGVDSALGFDTGLAPEDPAGMIVPDPVLSSGTSPGCDGAPQQAVTVGSAIVGAGGPLTHEQFGTPLFTDAAHRFMVSVPAFQAPDGALRDAIRSVIEREKPAHTDYALCFIEPAMRVGLQSLLGIDTYVADLPGSSSSAGMTLDLDAYLTATDAAGHIGAQSRLGRDTLLA